MTSSTSYRLSEKVKARLVDRARREGLTATALLERLITEGIDAAEHHGIVFRGPTDDRRAGLAGGPDVWEIIARLRELDGPEEERIDALAEESTLHPRLIRIALDYAAQHPDEITERITQREAAVRDLQQTVAARRALLA